jgi:hypothetical protein
MTYAKKRKAVILRFAETRAIYRKCRRSTPMVCQPAYLVAIAGLASKHYSKYPVVA